jgi:hypothetical protein
MELFLLKKEGKRAGSKKKFKTAELKIHNDKKVEPDYIPTGSGCIGYRDFVVQDIKIEPRNTRYRLKVYETQKGSHIVGKLPENLNGKYFGPTLIRFVLYQYYHCHVTQPLLLKQLHEIGINISTGHLNNLLIEGKEAFHQEKDDIISAGLQSSSYINVESWFDQSCTKIIRPPEQHWIPFQQMLNDGQAVANLVQMRILRPLPWNTVA